MNYEVKLTDEYEKLVRFFVENELEFDGDEEVDTDIVNCYEITDDNKLIGAAVLARREGEYIVDGIAVSDNLRGEGLGGLLLARLLEDVRELGGDKLYLVARAPEFFRKNNFQTINPDLAPNFFECKYCPQYGLNCHPEVMMFEIKG